MMDGWVLRENLIEDTVSTIISLCHVILGMCEIDVLFRFGFGSALKKNSYSVRNDFGSVQFEKKPRFGSNIIVIYYLCNS